MKWAAGALVATSGIMAQAQEAEKRPPDPKPFTRPLDMGWRGSVNAWQAAIESKLSQWKADREEILRRHKQVQSAIDALDKTPNPTTNEEQKVRELILFPQFSGYVIQTVSQMESEMRQKYEAMQILSQEQAGLKEGLTFIESIRAGKQPVNESTLGEAKKNLDQSTQEKQKTSDTLDAARKTLKERRAWIRGLGRSMNGSEYQTYLQEISSYDTARKAHKSAIQKYNRQDSNHHVLSTLMATPPEEHNAKLTELEASLNAKIGEKQAVLTENAAVLEKPYYDRLTQFYLLGDKLGQMWANPTGDWSIRLYKTDLQVMKEMMSLYLTTHKSHLSFVDTAIEKLTQKADADLRMKIEEGPTPWAQNFMIGSASDQENVSWGDLYFDRLMEEMASTQSLSKAVENMGQKSLKLDISKDGWSVGQIWQNPQVSTRVNDSWDAKKKDVKRKVLLILGSAGNDGDPIITPGHADKFKSKLREHFSLQEEDFTVLKGPTQQEVSEACDALQKKNDPETEILVLMHGHGNTNAFDLELKSEQFFRQGSASGKFMSKEMLTESFMKKQVDKLSGYKNGILVICSCYSGAWVAQPELKANTPENPFEWLYPNWNMPVWDNGTKTTA